jgi:hypothetical protein
VIHIGVQSASRGRTAGQFGNAQLLVRLIFHNVTEQTMSPPLDEVALFHLQVHEEKQAPTWHL